MAKILICDDEEGIRKVLTYYCQVAYHDVLLAENGKEAIEITKNENPDIIILDVMMPVLDGFSALREIRKFSDVPVIILSAKGEEYDKTQGFTDGVDDYVVKPFSSKEVLFRIDAILKRIEKINNKNTVYIKDTMCIDFDARKLTIDKQEIKLSPKEYEVLVLFVKNPNKAITRKEMLSKVWGYDYFGDDRTLDTHMKLLRKNLGEYANLITTIRGIGYRFEG